MQKIFQILQNMFYKNFENPNLNPNLNTNHTRSGVARLLIICLPIINYSYS